MILLLHYVLFGNMKKIIRIHLGRFAVIPSCGVVQKSFIYHGYTRDLKKSCSKQLFFILSHTPTIVQVSIRNHRASAAYLCL